MRRKLLISLLFTALSAALYAQDGALINGVRNHGVGVVLRNNGLGLSYQYQSLPVIGSFSRWLYADFTTFRHNRESKVVNHQVENRMPFVYGKLNHTGFARLNYGVSRRLVQRGIHNSIGLDIQVGMGMTAAFQRPVYLSVERIRDDQKVVEFVKYSPEEVPDSDQIIGYARNGEGWDQLEVRPGISATFNTAFTWSDYAHFVKRVNLGASVSYFPGGLPIMAFRDNPKLNTSFFVGFMWVFPQNR